MRQKLKLETIEVESFLTTPDLDKLGSRTVHGQSVVDETGPTCEAGDTCGLMPTVCQNTCGTCPTAGTTWSDSDFTACVACTTYGHPGGGDACNPTDLGTCINWCLG